VVTGLKLDDQRRLPGPACEPAVPDLRQGNAYGIRAVRARCQT
jgi:hypothetical protein